MKFKIEPRPTDIQQQFTPPECKGLFYRAIVNRFFNATDGSFIYKQQLKPLLRKSCTGCPSCDFLADEFYDNYLDTVEDKPIKHGGLYQLMVTNYDKDYYGEVDYDIDFVKVEEK